jgi:exodeoxyribonuclease V beta subunit
VPLDEALADGGQLMDVVRRAMRRNALDNLERGGDSTELTLARMVWRALNTCIEMGGREIFLKDVRSADRLAEVEFVVDEVAVLGADTPRVGDAVRDGVFNGKIDLLIRPDGEGGPVYILDWKTNSLADYGESGVESAMEAAGYPLQFKLYSLAVARWLGRDALAGIVYLFVRGGEHGSRSGVYARIMDDRALEDCRLGVLEAVSGGNR